MTDCSAPAAEAIAKPVGTPRGDTVLRVATVVPVAQWVLLLLRPEPIVAIDVISLGMTVLAALCWWRTWQAAPAAGAPERWRWRAAMIGWLLWSAQWGVNTVEGAILCGDQRIANGLILAHRVAFIVALVPIAPRGDPRLFRWLDAMLGAVLALLLTVLAWPELPHDPLGDPNRAYLYLGYVAMAALAGVSLIAQRAAAIRLLPLALFWTLVGYGTTGIVTRELYRAGLIGPDSPLFLFGDLAFVTYVALLPAGRSMLVANESASGATVAERAVPLLLTTIILALAFAVARSTPALGVVTALAAFAVHAARTMLAERLHHAVQRAAVSAARDRLATMVDLMHEVRSPLGAVALNVAMLRRSVSLGARERRICAAIDSGCASVVTLLEDVLSLERLEAGLMPSVIASHDLASIARETSALLEATWRTAGVAIQCPDTPFRAAVDRAAIHRILLNLIGNAIRFTPSGGTVTVSMVKARDASVVLGVSDTGIGMSTETRARLFQRFATAGQPLHGTRGSGLGLSISLALARTMGGTIRVTSEEGTGTLVEVVILQPVAKA